MSKSIVPNTSDNLFCTNKFISDFCLLGEELGLAREDFAKKIGLSLKSIENPQVVISRQYILKGYTILIDYADDELLGTGISKTPRGATDLLVKSACTEHSLAQALTAIEQVIRVSQSSVGSTIIIDDSIVRWQFSPEMKNAHFSQVISSLCAYMIHKILSMLIKREIPLLQAKFAGTKPINISDYQLLFACPLKFNQQNCEITFDKKWLKQPIRCDYHDVKHYLVVPLSLANYSLNTLGFIQRVKGLLSACPYAQFPSQQVLAEQLGISVRTLQRTLKNENASYMQLKDELRQRKALFYLEHTEKNIEEISQRCGFSEVASFTRAFTRWTGSTPAKFRI